MNKNLKTLLTMQHNLNTAINKEIFIIKKYQMNILILMVAKYTETMQQTTITEEKDI